ncbi:MAG: UbiX family flavin prenyltransferase [Candidatus Thermoplasmatota archaeon]|nr:UbiX family flavin prenyltransferase [Candidatus Thermoplasmatota archaeon]
MSERVVIVSLTGASGAGYGLELLKGLDSCREDGILTTVIYNDTALSIMERETGAGIDDLKKLCDDLVHTDRMDHRYASGSNPFDSMAICPCSTSTAAKVHAGISDNLTTRCASVALKERRKLVLVVRETPLSTPVLRALYELSSWGVIVMPASPPFYNLGHVTVQEVQRSFAGRVMDLLDLEYPHTARYDPGTW